MILKLWKNSEVSRPNSTPNKQTEYKYKEAYTTLMEAKAMINFTSSFPHFHCWKMQQRAIRTTTDDPCTIMNSTLSQDQPQGIRLSMDDFTAAGDLLPVSDPRFWIRKRDRNSRYRFRVHWIHLIPLILLLILFILWWSSYPGKFPQ